MEHETTKTEEKGDDIDVSIPISSFPYHCGTITYNLNGQNLMNGNQGSFNDVKSDVSRKLKANVVENYQPLKK